jgi:arylsulfatase A
MTGRNFVRIGVYPGVFSPKSIGGLFVNETTVATKFKTVGYRTGMCGKWHLGTREFHPTHHGFDVYYGAPMTQNECWSNLIAPGSTDKDGGFGPCPWFNGSLDVPTWQSPGVYPTDPHAVDMVNVDQFYDDSLAGFVRDAVLDNVPFFWYFASHHTHAPQFAACQTTGDFRGDDSLLANCTSKRGLFGDSLALLDRSVGRLHALLDELKIADKTLTIMSADNGGSLHWGILGGVNGDLRCGKGTLWEGGVRVPAIVRWPGVVQPNTVVQELTSSLDWMPTFSALAGYSLDQGKTYDGWDMSALLFGSAAQCDRATRECSTAGAAGARRDRYFYHTSEDSSGSLVAVRLGPWKLHFVTKGSHCNNDFPDAACYAPSTDHRDVGGLLFNVERDMSEVLPLSNTSYEFKMWAPVLWSMALEYTTKIFSPADQPPSQIDRGSSPDRFPCCNVCTPMPNCCSCGNRTSPVYV